MTIEYVQHPKNPAARIFRLDNFPSVIPTEKGKIRLNKTHQAHDIGSPVAAAILTRFRNDIEAVEMASAGGQNGTSRVDAICVILKHPDLWENETTAQIICSMLKERLQNKGTLLIVPDMRQAFQISANDIRKSIKQFRPETVIEHNEETADNAITVKDDGWDPKTKSLTCIMGEKCAAGACSELNKIATQNTLAGHLRTRYPGIRVLFKDGP